MTALQNSSPGIAECTVRPAFNGLELRLRTFINDKKFTTTLVVTQDVIDDLPDAHSTAIKEEMLQSLRFELRKNGPPVEF
jgi:hypothetical protein